MLYFFQYFILFEISDNLLKAVCCLESCNYQSFPSSSAGLVPAPRCGGSSHWASW
ncbi:Structure-specific endonuclease subunit SLX1-like protein, partial [Frankliniella fusca]